MSHVSITNGMLQSAAVDNSKALFVVQEATAGTIMQSGKYQEQMAKTMMRIGNNAVQEAVKNLQKLIKAEEEAKHASLWEKIFGGILTAIMSIVACVTAQPEIAVVSIALYAASMTGGTKWAEGAIANVLHDAFGLPKSAGRLIGALLIIIAAVAVGAGGKAAVGKIAELAGSIGTKAAAETAETAASEEAQNATTEETTQESQAGLKGKVTSLLKKIPAPLARALATGGMAMGSVNLGGLLAEAVHDKKLEAALEAVVAILSLVAGLVGGGAMGVQSATTGGLTVWSTRTLKAAGYASGLGSLGQAGSSGATGYFDDLQGQAAEAMGRANAKLELFNSMKEMGIGQWSSFIKELEHILQAEGKASSQVAKGMFSSNAHAARLMA